MFVIVILSVAVLVSHLAGTPVLQPNQIEPVQLQQAQQLMLSRPAECVAITQLFLQRKEIDPAKLVNSRQDFDQEAMSQHYRSREQSLMAWQIQALCQANEGLLLPAHASINQAIKLAKRYHQTDSHAAGLMIKAKLSLAKQDAAQAKKLLNNAQTLLNEESADALQQALPLLQASTLFYQQKMEEARLAFEHIRLQAQENNQQVQQAWANYLLANYYQLIQQDELALAHYIETLSLLGKRRLYYLKAQAAEKAAAINATLGKSEQAIHFANLAASEFESLGNPNLLISSLLNLGRVTRTSSEDASLALVYFFNALNLAKILVDNEQIAQLYLEIGHSYRLLDKPSEALPYLSQARASFERNKDIEPAGAHKIVAQQQKTLLLIDTLHQLGQLYMSQQESGLALLQLEQALTLAERINNVPRLIESHRLLALLFEHINNPNQALIHYQAYHEHFAQASQLNRLLTQSLVQDNDQQLQQERELVSLRQQSEQLQRDKRLFSSLAIALSVSTVLLLYAAWRNLLSRRRLQEQNTGLTHSLLLESRTGLPNWRQFMLRLPKDVAKSQLSSEQWYLNETQAQPFDDKIYYLLLHVPFMVDLSERLGLVATKALQQQLGTYLQGRIHPEARLYDLREGQFIYVIAQRQVSSLQETLANLQRMFEEFPSAYDLDKRLAIGIIGHPFLPKAPHALDDMRMGDILYLAMAAAHQLSKETGDRAWVELLALDCQQAAFFNGDIRHCCIQAILKGLVKVNCSHKKHYIDWQALAPELAKTV